jgi:hypothetical protein
MLEVDVGSTIAPFGREVFHTRTPLPELERRKFALCYVPQLDFCRHI